MRKRLLVASLLAVLTVRAGIDPRTFDSSVKPQDDFYQYVNGRWLATVVIPPDLARLASFIQLQQDNWTKLHELCAAASAKDAAGATPSERLVGDFFASGMDAAGATAAGMKPLQPELERIAAINSAPGIVRELAHLKMIGVQAGFSFGSAPDDKDSTREIATVRQGGLGFAISDLPRDADRDYYLDTTPERTKLRELYVAHIAKVFALAGDSPNTAQDGAQRVLQLETELARVSNSRVKLRDPVVNYHRMSLDELRRLAPALDWTVYLAEAGSPAFQDVNVAQPDFVRGLGEALRSTPVADWKLYLRWQLLRRAAPFLGEPFESEHFKFFGTAMTGVTEPEPRWKRVVIATDQSIGDALGQLYVSHYFKPEAKGRALALVANVRAALRERLAVLDWMDEPTRTQALAKLDAFTVKIGYPEKWKDYSTVQIDRGPFVLNVFHAAEFQARRNLAKIGRPVDKTEWEMTAPTVNAYYSPSINGITFPAGILQPPFFDPNADYAVNYGGIGAVVGHEMTHGFDDSGRQYDAAGNLKDWWTPESAARFQQRAEKIVQQYSAYVATGDIHLNGKLTEGENIADLGGLKVAFAALEKALKDKPRPIIDGLTPEQRFFVNEALVWRDVMRPAEAARRAAVDPHSPGKWRVNGPLSNLDEFARAFDVPDGAPMRRPAAERVTIW